MKRSILTLLLSLAGTCVIAKDGVYLEFKISSQLIHGTSKTFAADGNTRSEMTMTNVNMPTPINTITLIKSEAPNTTYSLNEKDKTYTVSESGKNTAQAEEDYDVVVVGKETINGYNCLHVNIVYKTTPQKSDMWLSKDIPGYASYTTVKTDQLGGAGFFDKLKAKGADGFVVRMQMKMGKGEVMQMDLVKAERRNIDDGLFTLNGYTKSAMPDMMNMEQLKNMTPEQRKQYMMQMQEKYKQH